MLRYRQALPYLDFYVNAGDLNSGPRACAASTSLAEPPPQAPILLLTRAFQPDPEGD